MKKKYKIFFSLFLTIILIWFLIIQVDLKNFGALFKKMNPLWFLAAFASFISASFFQAQRFKTLLQNRLSLFYLLNVVCIHNFFLNILPFRSGELSYLYLINKSGGIKTGENLSSLIVARFLDFFSVSLFFFISLRSVIKTGNYFLGQVSLLLSLLLILLLVIFAGIIFYPQKLNRLTENILRKTTLDRFRMFVFFRQKMKETLASIQKLKSEKLFLFLCLNSLMVWFFFYGVTFFAVKGIGLNLSFSQAMFISSFPIFFASFFIQGIGGFGTVESGLTAGLVVIGFSKDIAVGASFLIHIAILICLSLLALISFLNLKKKFIT